MRLTINDELASRLEKYAKTNETASETMARLLRAAAVSHRRENAAKAAQRELRAYRKQVRDVFIRSTDTPRARYVRITGRFPEETS